MGSTIAGNDDGLGDRHERARANATLVDAIPVSDIRAAVAAAVALLSDAGGCRRSAPAPAPASALPARVQATPPSSGTAPQANPPTGLAVATGSRSCRRASPSRSPPPPGHMNGDGKEQALEVVARAGPQLRAPGAPRRIQPQSGRAVSADPFKSKRLRQSASDEYGVPKNRLEQDRHLRRRGPRGRRGLGLFLKFALTDDGPKACAHAAVVGPAEPPQIPPPPPKVDSRPRRPPRRARATTRRRSTRCRSSREPTPSSAPTRASILGRVLTAPPRRRYSTHAPRSAFSRGSPGQGSPRRRPPRPFSRRLHRRPRTGVSFAIARSEPFRSQLGLPSTLDK